MVGKRIAEARRAKGLTQSELAEKAEISRYTLVKIENGDGVNMTAHTLLNIARVLGVSTDFLLCHECQ